MMSAVIVSDKSSLNTKSTTMQEGYKCYILCLSTKYMSEENIESAQRRQRKIGTAEENPEASGHAENL
jgi:hypothetical protein